MAPVVPVPTTQQLLNQARHRAVKRMRQECAALGGDGVVGVRLSVMRFHEIGYAVVRFGGLVLLCLMVGSEFVAEPHVLIT